MESVVDPTIVSYVVTIILGVLATFFGKKWITAKDYFSKVTLTATKFAMALKDTSDAIEDDNITPEEAKRIIASWRAVIEEAKSFVNK